MSAIRHMMLPVITLSVAPTNPVIRRMVHPALLERMTRTIRQSGGDPRFVALYYFLVLRRLHNALPPVIPRSGLQFSTMLTLAMITEMVFSWPGLGRWLINAMAIGLRSHFRRSDGVVHGYYC